MVRLPSCRIAAVLPLLCIAVQCQSNVSSIDNKFTDHDAERSAEDKFTHEISKFGTNESPQHKEQILVDPGPVEGISLAPVEYSWPWPWHHKNNTDKKNSTGGGGDDDKNNKTDTSCASHKSCLECTESSWGCHWCAHDEACHAIGSVHGCLTGASCDKKNGTDPDDNGGGGGGDDKNKNKTETSCAAHKNCTECTESSWGCHWCAHDDACHAIGSVHGCLTGVDCNKKNGTDPDDKNKNKTNTSCAAHTNCTGCTESTWGCHWCAHDEACHPIGSVHGCLTGVNCYSEDRCTRKVPETIRGYDDWSDVGTIPLIVILSVAGLVICCATCCLGVACCMRGTYEDYATLAVANAGDSVWVGEEIGGDDHRKRTVVFHDATAGDDAVDDNADDDDDAPREGTEYQRLLDDNASNDADEESLAHTRITAARSQVMSSSSNTKCMFNTCTVCYAVTVFAVGALALMGVVYSPKRPQINVCADALAWKSIVDGMTSFQMQASFQILMSVQNPNKFDVVIDMASGNFNHKGAQVGTFNVPPTKIESMAITDILVSVTFTPDKWEALSLTAEYYKGTLSFLVDMQAAIEIPALANYTFDFKVDNYNVLANDPSLQDRHLCYCPDKNGGKNEDRPATATASPAAAAASELFPIAEY